MTITPFHCNLGAWYISKTDLTSISGFLNNLSCEKVPFLSYNLSFCLIYSPASLCSAWSWSFHCLFSAHFGVTSWFPDSCERSQRQKWSFAEMFSCPFFSFPASNTINKGRVITCTQELPGKSRSRSWKLYEICFCLRFCCIQSDQQVLAKCWAWFPVGLCKALQDNKRFGGTE